MFKNISLPQALVFVACLAAPVAAYKFLGSVEAGAALAGAGMLISFLLGRPADEKKEGAS